MSHLKVAVRVRPLSQRELGAESISIVGIESGKTVTVTNIKVPEQYAGDSRVRTRRFTFDYCFETGSTQNEIFESVEAVVQKAMRKRYHSCVLAYGQSSSGKTHTMMGDPYDPGVTPKLCENMFKYLEGIPVGEGAKNISVSYLEIYNEKVRDLLNSSCVEKSTVLKVREHPKTGPYVQGLSVHPADGPEALLELLHTGTNNRRVAATLTNPKSSRSHSVFTLTFLEGVKLHLIDLAGSERAGSRCPSTSRFKEGANINKSLVALGNVITALADQTTKPRNSRKRFVPYRDSVLTWLLKDTLGGNSKTLMIATISPSSSCYSETVNTLRFGQRAKQIVSQPVVNEDPKERTIRELREEITRLRELLNKTQIGTSLAHQLCLCKSLEDKSTSGSPSGAVEKVVENNINLSSDISDITYLLSKNIRCSIENVNKVEEKVTNKDAASKKAVISEKITTERLIPVMDVTSNVSKEKKASAPLRRTFSVSGSEMERKNSKIYGSHEVLTSPNQKKPPSTLRKRSIDQSNSSIKSLPGSKEKKSPTDTPTKEEAKTMNEAKKVEARVDSIRKTPIKPRSEIVAAVTQRLYNKIKRKEVGTETDDMVEKARPMYMSPATRAKLRELTAKALRAHRRRNEETQTDLNPIRRVKETSTDVFDLKLEILEVKNADTNTPIIEMVDAGVSCCFLDSFDNDSDRSSLVVTRSCGTQCNTCFDETKIPPQPANPISFTKYLSPQNVDPKIEMVGCSSPIYTASVNINVSHNYVRSGNLSEDSLEDHAQNAVCFPTPDLISNHNSLENNHQGGSDSKQTKPEIKFASTNVILENRENYVNESSNNPKKKSEICFANYSYAPKCEESLQSIDFSTVFAPQICVVKDFRDCSTKSLPTPPESERFKVLNCDNHPSKNFAIPQEARVFKSIMRNAKESSEASSSSESTTLLDSDESEVDSLDYHKKVRFGQTSSNEKMLEVMSNFLREATSLMTNLTKVASTFENCKSMDEQTFEFQVTVNDVTGKQKTRSKHKKKEKKQYRRDVSSQTQKFSEESCSQTPLRRSVDAWTYCDDDELSDDYQNKYDNVVLNSCDQLEERINAILSESSAGPGNGSSRIHEDHLHRFPQPFTVSNDWFSLPPINLTGADDSSLDSNITCSDNPTFSDYGSLPRRRSHRPRPSCSPSAYLRHLTNLRQQIVENSREELQSQSNFQL